MALLGVAMEAADKEDVSHFSAECQQLVGFVLQLPVAAQAEEPDEDSSWAVRPLPSLQRWWTDAKGPAADLEAVCIASAVQVHGLSSLHDHVSHVAGLASTTKLANFFELDHVLESMPSTGQTACISELRLGE